MQAKRRKLNPPEVDEALKIFDEMRLSNNLEEVDRLIMNQHKINLKLQLEDAVIAEKAIPALLEQIRISFYNSLLSPGEAHGHVAAMMNSEPIVQAILKSVSANTNSPGGSMRASELFEILRCSAKPIYDYITFTLKENLPSIGELISGDPRKIKVSSYEEVYEYGMSCITPNILSMIVPNSVGALFSVKNMSYALTTTNLPIEVYTEALRQDIKKTIGEYPEIVHSSRIDSGEMVLIISLDVEALMKYKTITSFNTDFSPINQRFFEERDVVVYVDFSTEELFKAHLDPIDVSNLIHNTILIMTDNSPEIKQIPKPKVELFNSKITRFSLYYNTKIIISYLNSQKKFTETKDIINMSIEVNNLSGLLIHWENIDDKITRIYIGRFVEKMANFERLVLYLHAFGAKLLSFGNDMFGDVNFIDIERGSLTEDLLSKYEKIANIKEKKYREAMKLISSWNDTTVTVFDKSSATLVADVLLGFGIDTESTKEEPTILRTKTRITRETIELNSKYVGYAELGLTKIYTLLLIGNSDNMERFMYDPFVDQRTITCGNVNTMKDVFGISICRRYISHRLFGRIQEIKGDISQFHLDLLVDYLTGFGANFQKFTRGAVSVRGPLPAGAVEDPKKHFSKGAIKSCKFPVNDPSTELIVGAESKQYGVLSVDLKPDETAGLKILKQSTDKEMRQIGENYDALKLGSAYYKPPENAETYDKNEFELPEF